MFGKIRRYLRGRKARRTANRIFARWQREFDRDNPGQRGKLLHIEYPTPHASTRLRAKKLGDSGSVYSMAAYLPKRA